MPRQFLTSEHKKKIGDANRGKKRTSEQKKQLSDAHTGHVGNKATYFQKGMVSNMKGKKHTPESREKMSKARKGKKLSLAHRKSMSESCKGVKSVHWKGGKTAESLRIRHSLEIKLWREQVFKRDNWTCTFCHKRGGTLNADHIKPFSLFPNLRFDINNGRTLCLTCHQGTDSYLYKVLKLTKKDYE